MSMFRQHRTHGKITAPAARAAAAAAKTPATPIFKYRINEELANKLAARAYGMGPDGRPNIPRMPFSG